MGIRPWRRYDDFDSAKQPVRDLLLNLVEKDGGPLTWPRITESAQNEFDATCRQAMPLAQPAKKGYPIQRPYPEYPWPEFLRVFRVVPDLGVFQLPRDLGQPCSLGVEVKDTSAARRPEPTTRTGWLRSD
jgi:hypothetical protein